MKSDRSHIEDQLASGKRMVEESKGFLREANPRTLRTKLAVASIDLSIEHLSGFLILSGNKRFASAAAMLRPIAESAMCACWLYYVPALATVQALVPAEGIDTPTLDDMARAINRQKIKPEGFSKLVDLIPSTNWKQFHKFTHGGLVQLENRFASKGFSDEEIWSHVFLARTFGMAALSTGVRLFPSQELIEYVENLRHTLMDHIPPEARPTLGRILDGIPEGPYQNEPEITDE